MRFKIVGSWELGVGSWELGVGKKIVLSTEYKVLSKLFLKVISKYFVLDT